MYGSFKNNIHGIGPQNNTVTYAASQHQGHLSLITCKRLKLLRKAGGLQLIQNCQCMFMKNALKTVRKNKV